jgi:hypothetical protein
MKSEDLRRRKLALAEEQEPFLDSRDALCEVEQKGDVGGG